MTSITKALELARDLVAANETAYVMPGSLTLARALLALAPVVEAAERLYDNARKCHDRPYMGCYMSHDTIVSAIGDEIDTYRASTKERPNDE